MKFIMDVTTMIALREKEGREGLSGWGRAMNIQQTPVLILTEHFPANLGICPVNFPLRPIKLILAAMYTL